MIILVIKSFLPAWVDAVTLWPFIFIKIESPSLDDRLLNHERIHFRQQWECGLAGLTLALGLNVIFGFSWWFIIPGVTIFYWIYLANYIYWRLFFGLDAKTSYRLVAFEAEAYRCDHDMNYLEHRQSYAWLRFFRPPDIHSSDLVT